MLLREVEGHSLEELAAMTGLNQNTIKVKLFRTRQKLLQAARRLGKCETIRSNSGRGEVAPLPVASPIPPCRLSPPAVRLPGPRPSLES